MQFAVHIPAVKVIAVSGGGGEGHIVTLLVFAASGDAAAALGAYIYPHAAVLGCGRLFFGGGLFLRGGLRGLLGGGFRRLLGGIIVISIVPVVADGDRDGARQISANTPKNRHKE